MFDLQIIRGLFLLILAVSANFVGNLLGCKTQKLLTENIYAKHIVLFSLIYFTTDLTSKEVTHPYETLKNTSKIWVFYLLFTKMDIQFTIVVFTLLCTLYVLRNYYEYLLDNEDNNDYNNNKNIKRLLKDYILKYLPYMVIIILIIGFIKYYIEKRGEYKDFNNLTFIFGSLKCRSLKGL